MAAAELSSNSKQTKCIPVAIEGPYGPPSLYFLRYDSLLMVAGGIGITPFLSILQEIEHSATKGLIPTQIQLIYVVKSSPQVCLLDSVLPLLLNHRAEEFGLKLKVFVTQEHSGPTLRQLLNDLSGVKTVHFETLCTNHAAHGPENSLWMAAIVGFSSIMFIIVLSCFNRAFLHSGKKASKQKHPSSQIDLFLFCSFALAVVCGALAAVVVRWRRLKTELPRGSHKHGKEIKLISMETGHALEEHEIHYGGRPDFQDVFSRFPDETGGSDIGVLVCGPEPMKESVASLCQMSSQGFRRKKPYFSFHSLNFTL